MSPIWKKKGWGQAALVICLTLAAGACRTTSTAPQPVTHIVLMWLKHPESASDRAEIVRAARSLRMMPGVTRVETGRALPMPASAADRDFDLGVVIIFRDRAALERYEKDPRHAQAVERYLRPLVRRYVVYNLGTR